MSEKTKKLTVAALLSAAALVLLLLGSLLPVWKLAFAALAGVVTAAVLIECGGLRALLSWAAVSLLGLLLLPQKSLPLLYAAFFGWYPLVKSLAERRANRVWEWGIKLLTFNLACGVCYALLRLGFFADLPLPELGLVLLWLLLNAAFVLYDLALSGLIAFYLQRIHNKMN